MATETTKLTFVEGAAASTPAASRAVIYSKADGLMYSKDDAGAETLMSGGAAGMANPLTTTGDMIYSSSGTTAARLAIGAAGGHVSRINGAIAWDSGTAMPSAATGDRFWRTDLGREYYYDGTRWLTVAEYAHPLSNLDALQPAGANPANALWGVTDLGPSGQWITRVVWSGLLGATNDGSNYHTYQFTSRSTAGTGSNIGSTWNTSAVSASTWPRADTAIGAAVTAAHTHFVLVQTATGAPTANVYNMCTVYYRLIGA